MLAWFLAIDPTFFLTLGALVIIVLANNVIGMAAALSEGTFDPVKAKKGLIKSLGILLALIMGYSAGFLIPSMSFPLIDGQLMTVHQAMSALLTVAFISYFVNFIKKLAEAMNISVPTAKVFAERQAEVKAGLHEATSIKEEEKEEEEGEAEPPA